MEGSDRTVVEQRFVGFGDSDFTFAVYIANRPSMTEYRGLSNLRPLIKGEIDSINLACGNGWRKVFNVYAKVLYSLDQMNFTYSRAASTWQYYRDKHLLQTASKTALMFNPPELSSTDVNPKGRGEAIHIICGKTYAKSLIQQNKLHVELTWLDKEFAIDKKNNVIVCPYFDYRQLSNVKIEFLSELVNILSGK